MSGPSSRGHDQDQPPGADEPTPAERERPEEQAHGGSMAPGIVHPTGRPTGDGPDPAEPPSVEPPD